MEKKKEKRYKPVNLPEGMIEELKAWKSAYAAAYGIPVTYEKMLRGMLDGLEDTDPAVYHEFERLMKMHPEMLDRFRIEDDD